MRWCCIAVVLCGFPLSLHAIPKTKHGLVEAGRRSTHSAHGFEDSGLDLRESLASGLTSRQESAGSRAGSARSPPGLLVKAATVPLSPRPRSPLRKVCTYDDLPHIAWPWYAYE